MTQEAKDNVVFLDDKELKVKDFNDQQKYFYQQIVDLKNKQTRIQFELDQGNIPRCNISGLVNIILAFFLISPRSFEGVSPSKVARSSIFKRSGKNRSRKARSWS